MVNTAKMHIDRPEIKIDKRNGNEIIKSFQHFICGAFHAVCVCGCDSFFFSLPNSLFYQLNVAGNCQKWALNQDRPYLLCRKWIICRAKIKNRLVRTIIAWPRWKLKFVRDVAHAIANQTTTRLRNQMQKLCVPQEWVGVCIIWFSVWSHSLF